MCLDARACWVWVEEESLGGQVLMMPERWQWSSSYSVAADTSAEYCNHYREKEPKRAYLARLILDFLILRSCLVRL